MPRDLSPRASSADTHHDVVVVGNGPIGSAVARHCSSLGASVLVLDGRDALTSASDDMGRIVRPLDAEGRETWTRLNVRSIEAFPELESESGIAFFRRCGSVACGTPAFVEKPAARLREAGIGFDELGDGALVERAFPYLSVPSAHVAIADRVGGFVDPKKMIEAQNALTLRANPEENRILLANATEILERGLKVKEYELQRKNFSATGNFGFGVTEHIDLGIKYDPTTGIYGMDFYVCLERPGFRVARRKARQARVGVKHRITKDQAVQWFQQKYEGIVLG